MIINKILSLIVGIKRGFFDDGFGDLVGELVEVSEVLLSAGIIITSSGSAATSSGCGRVCRGLTAFIHHLSISGASVFVYILVGINLLLMAVGE